MSLSRALPNATPARASGVTGRRDDHSTNVLYSRLGWTHLRQSDWPLGYCSYSPALRSYFTHATAMTNQTHRTGSVSREEVFATRPRCCPNCAEKFSRHHDEGGYTHPQTVDEFPILWTCRCGFCDWEGDISPTLYEDDNLA